MSVSEQDSRILDKCRRKNELLQIDNQCLREEIRQLKLKQEQQFRRIRDILKEN